MENDLIVLANELIESKHSYTELEAKLIFSFAALIDRDDSDFWTYSIQAKKIGDYKEVKRSCKSIMTKAIIIEKENSNYLVLNWFADIEYKNGLVEASFSPKMKPYMLSLKKELGFTKIGLKNIMSLNSRYLIRLYTLFKKEQFKTIYKIGFKELCELIQVPKSYYMFKNFKSKILDNLEEINKNTDIYITFQLIKKGKTVTDIEFMIQKDDFENFVKDIRKRYSNYSDTKDVILYENQKNKYTLNINGHIESNGEELTKGLADRFWRRLYKKSKVQKLEFKI